MSPIRKHHWLVSGFVVYELPDQPQLQQISLNCLVLTKNPVITRSDLASAQSTMLQRFGSEIAQAPQAQIRDVFLITFTPLGHMTDDEFNHGFEKQTKRQPHQDPRQMNLELG